jgi:hypothetical protein
MKVAVAVLCAGLAFAAGCAMKLGNTRVEASVQVDEQAINTKLETAVEKVKAELQMRGLEVDVRAEADATRLACATKAGDRFTVVLSRFRTVTGTEETKVRVEWGAKPDRELWLGLLVAVAAEAARPVPERAHGGIQ